METKIRKIQTAIFTRNFNISNDLERASLLTEINKSVGHIFNGMPTQLPIPNDAPPEFPRFILNSLDNKFSCQVALSRVDVFYNIPNESTDDCEQLFEIQKNNIQNVFNFLLSKSEIFRVGFITVMEAILSQEEGNSTDYLRNNFIQKDRFISPKELLFNYNCAGKSENFDMNNLIIINAKENANIILQTDINTVAEGMDKNKFNLENFIEIIDYAVEKTKELKSSFPNI